MCTAAVMSAPSPTVHSRLGAISQGGDARRPLTHCDSYRLPGMLLLACRSRLLHAIGFL